VAISLIILLNLHLKLRTQLELITILARTIALSNVAPPITQEGERSGSSPASELKAPSSPWNAPAAARDGRRSRRKRGRSA
jgi:hypothetical protein